MADRGYRKGSYYKVYLRFYADEVQFNIMQFQEYRKPDNSCKRYCDNSKMCKGLCKFKGITKLYCGWTGRYGEKMFFPKVKKEEVK